MISCSLAHVQLVNLFALDQRKFPRGRPAPLSRTSSTHAPAHLLLPPTPSAVFTRVPEPVCLNERESVLMLSFTELWSFSSVAAAATGREWHWERKKMYLCAGCDNHEIYGTKNRCLCMWQQGAKGIIVYKLTDQNHKMIVEVYSDWKGNRRSDCFAQLQGRGNTHLHKYIYIYTVYPSTSLDPFRIAWNRAHQRGCGSSASTRLTHRERQPLTYGGHVVNTQNTTCQPSGFFFSFFSWKHARHVTPICDLCIPI